MSLFNSEDNNLQQVRAHIITEEDLKKGDILYHLSEEYSIPYWKLQILNDYPKRSDFTTGEKTSVILQDIEEDY